jgi:anti-sigma B factor antagonist
MTDTQPQVGLELRESARDGWRTLALAGEPDLATAARFKEVIRRICADGAPGLLLDLRELSFLDSTGLRVLFDSRALCEEHSCRLLRTRGRPHIERLFELTGSASILPALAHTPGP